MTALRTSELEVPARNDVQIEVSLMSENAAQESTRARRIELQGLLGAIGWGLDDKVNRAALFTTNEDVYEVLLSEGAADLLRHLRRVVNIEGELTESAQGMKAVRVDSYRVIE